MSKNWADIWESRVDTPRKMNHLELLKANGYDNKRSALLPWNLTYAQEFYWNIIRLQERDSVYEVGCGSGAFLYSLYKEGYQVGGIDLSKNLIDLAVINLHGGNFTCGDAQEINAIEKWDHVVSFGLFFYFPSAEYAETLILKMLEKANKSVSIYELPDLDRKEECEAMRRVTTPNYDRDYAGLEHLYFSKQWFCNFARKHGLHLTLFDQVIPNYENGKYRFCAVFNKIL